MAKAKVMTPNEAFNESASLQAPAGNFARNLSETIGHDNVTGDEMTHATKVAGPIDEGFVIDDAIPLPTNARVAKYPWDRLMVGQSFFVSGGKQASFMTSCATVGKKTGRKFITRKWTQDSLDGVRVWRVA